MYDYICHMEKGGSEGGGGIILDSIARLGEAHFFQLEF